MAGTYTSIAQVATNLKLEQAPLTNEFTTRSISPQEIAGHMEKKSFIIAGMTPSYFNDLHGAVETDLIQLASNFKKICKDYGADLSWDIKSMAVEFCSKMIFEVGPESRQVKKADGDKVWKFKFPYNKNGTPDVRVVFVATFKTQQPTKLTADNNQLTLTIKQAGLLAIDTFIRLAKLIYDKKAIIMLTPLAGARTDIPKIAEMLKIKVPDLIGVINSSCQSGGHLIKASRSHCAAVAAIVATRNLKGEKIKQGIIAKVVRQYINAGKKLEVPKFEIYAMFAHGGVPAGLDPVTLESTFDNAQKIKISAKKIATIRKETAMESETLVPRKPIEPLESEDLISEEIPESP